MIMCNVKQVAGNDGLFSSPHLYSAFEKFYNSLFYCLQHHCLVQFNCTDHPYFQQQQQEAAVYNGKGFDKHTTRYLRNTEWQIDNVIIQLLGKVRNQPTNSQLFLSRVDGGQKQVNRMTEMKANVSLCQQLDKQWFANMYQVIICKYFFVKLALLPPCGQKTIAALGLIHMLHFFVS